MIKNINLQRRSFLKIAGSFSLFLSAPAYAFDIFKVIDPEGKSKDLQKAKQMLKGAGDIVASSKELDYESELAIGESLALEGFRRYGMPSKNKSVQKYVNLVGNAVARNSSRPKIPYHFVVVDSKLYNAFACPGGIIFVSSTLVKNMKSEAELACVLSHEVAHVCHKHALKSIKRAKFLEGVTKITTANMKGEEGRKFRNMIGGLQEVLFDKGLDKNMEFEADISGMEFAYRTGYNPDGLIKTLKMLKQKESAAQKKGSWFSTHPPLRDRLGRCNSRMASYPDFKDLASVGNRFSRYKKFL